MSILYIDIAKVDIAKVVSNNRRVFCAPQFFNSVLQDCTILQYKALIIKMGELHLCWMGNIEQLKQFVSDNIELNGVWVSPGGDKKKYSDGDTSISWRKGNKVLRIEGKGKNQINAKLFQ